MVHLYKLYVNKLYITHLNLNLLVKLWYIKWRFKIYIYEIYSFSIIILSIYKSCDWIYVFHEMIIEIVLNNETFIFQILTIYIFKRKRIYLCTLLGKKKV